MPRRRLSRTIGDLPVTAANLVDYSARVVVPTLRELIRAWNDWQQEGTVTVKVDGTTIGTRNAINLVTGTAITITGVDDSGNDEVDVTLDVSAAGGGVTVRKNTGADVGTRPRLNLIEGAGISLTVADDAGSSEVDVTVASTITQYTDELAQDAIGTILLDSATIDFTYDDGTPSITAIVIDDSISNAKLRNSGALSVIGRSANSAGDPADISATAGTGYVLLETGSTLAFGQVQTAGIANDAVTFAKMQDINSGVVIGRSSVGTGDPQELTYAALAALLDHGTLLGLSDDDHTQYLLANGSRALTADWDAGSFEVRAQTFESDVATGTAPLVIASTTLVTNLNADLLDGQHGAYYLDSANFTGTDWTDLTDGGSTTLHTHDHGGLGGLSDDDHTQYLLLAGRAGGQTAYGGTAASENLNLNATAHATKGTVTITGLREKIAANDTLWIDAANANVFMGSADPGNVATVSGQNNVAIGDAAATSLGAGGENTAVGQYALNAVVGNSYNTGIGRYALPFVTGTGNTALGRASGLALSTASYTVSIGAEVGTGRVGNSGDYNVLIGAHISAAGATLAECMGGTGTGYIAIAANQTLMEADGEYRNVYIGSSKPGNYRTSSGTDNVAIGDNALGSATTPVGVVAIGSNAAGSLSTESESGVFIGQAAASTVVAPNASTIVGALAAQDATTLAAVTAMGRRAARYGGTAITAIGTYAGYGATSAATSATFVGYGVGFNGTNPSDYATGVGAQALYDSSGATGTSAFGFQAGQNVTSGSYNLLAGYNAAPTLTTGQHNVILGAYEGANTLADVPAAGSNNYIVLAGTDSIAVVDPTLRSVHVGSSKPGNWLTASGTDNVAIGDNALGSATTASTVIAIGTSAAGSASTAPEGGVFIGHSAAGTDTDPEAATVIGQSAAYLATTLSYTTIIGRVAAPYGGAGTVAIGSYAGYGATSAVTGATYVGHGIADTNVSPNNYATAVGNAALKRGNGATGTSAFGFQAGQNVTSGAYNLLAGYNAAPTLTSGNNCVVLGAYEDTSVYADVASADIDGQIVIAAEGSSEGGPLSTHIVVMPNNGNQNVTDANTIVGAHSGNWRAGLVAGNGFRNTIFGAGNAFGLTSGNHNVLLGYNNATSLTTGDRNLIVGQNLDVPAAGTDDYMSLGGAIFGDLSANKTVRIGGSGAVSQTERLAVTQATADTSEVLSIETTSTNGAKSRFYVGDQSPSGTITALPGSVYCRVNGTSSTLYVNNGAGSGTTWVNLDSSSGVSDGDKGDVVVSGSGATWTLELVYAPGSLSLATGTFRQHAKRLQMTGSQRLTAAGTARFCNYN